jgi:hypothetical protein
LTHLDTAGLPSRPSVNRGLTPNTGEGPSAVDHPPGSGPAGVAATPAASLSGATNARGGAGWSDRLACISSRRGRREERIDIDNIDVPDVGTLQGARLETAPAGPAASLFQRLHERPEVAFEVVGAVHAVTVGLVDGLVDDGGALAGGVAVMRVHVVDHHRHGGSGDAQGSR